MITFMHCKAVVRVRVSCRVRFSVRVSFTVLSSFHIMPNINKLMILAYGERMLRVLFVVKSESM